MNKFKFLFINILLCLSVTLSAKDYKASLFGVKSDGIVMNTGSIQYAIDYISENGGGTLVFYVGRYVTGSIYLKSNVSIKLMEGAVLVGSPSVYDYKGDKNNKSLIIADDQENISISGKGVIQGRGASLLSLVDKQIKKGYFPSQESPALISMSGCSNINIEGIIMLDGSGTVQKYDQCKGLTIKNITVKSKAVPESCGLVLSNGDEVKVEDSFFDTSDTEIKLKGNSQISIINCVNAKGKKLHGE